MSRFHTVALAALSWPLRSTPPPFPSQRALVQAHHTAVLWGGVCSIMCKDLRERLVKNRTGMLHQIAETEQHYQHADDMAHVFMAVFDLGFV